MNKIKISDIYIGEMESFLYILSRVPSDPYMQQMIKDIDRLPPIQLINLGNEYSLTNGHHRLAAHIFLNKQEINAEVLNNE